MKKQEKKSQIFSYTIPTPSLNKELYTPEDVVNEYYEYLGKMTYRKIKHREDAEDLLHMIFQRILTYFGSIDHSKLAICISQHCYYAHKDWMRTCYREAGDPNVMYSMFDPDFTFKDPELETADPYLNYLRDNAGLCLANKLTMLSSLDAKVFALYYLSDCSTEDVAEELNSTKRAIYTRICRIRKELSYCYDSHNLGDYV